MKRVLRRLRGILGTALVWAVPWAIGGALVTLVATLIPPGGSAWLQSPSALLGVVGASARVFGILGALCGAAFAGTLALLGRRVTLADLRTATVLEAGAIGGALVPLTALTARTLLVGAAGADAYLAISLSSVFGAGSAWLMLRIAHRAIEASPPVQLGAPAPVHIIAPGAAPLDPGSESSRSGRRSLHAPPPLFQRPQHESERVHDD